jgi:hypothetical protein
MPTGASLFVGGGFGGGGLPLHVDGSLTARVALLTKMRINSQRPLLVINRDPSSWAAEAATKLYQVLSGAGKALPMIAVQPPTNEGSAYRCIHFVSRSPMWVAAGVVSCTITISTSSTSSSVIKRSLCDRPDGIYNLTGGPTGASSALPTDIMCLLMA